MSKIFTVTLALVFEQKPLYSLSLVKAPLPDFSLFCPCFRTTLPHFLLLIFLKQNGPIFFTTKYSLLELKFRAQLLDLNSASEWQLSPPGRVPSQKKPWDLISIEVVRNTVT